MKLLVTGAAGYLGSVLCKSLLEKGYEVRGIDAGWYGTEQIKECLTHKNFEYIESDIRNLITMVKALSGIDGVIHLASIVGMPASSIEPRTSEEVNYIASKNMAELCQLHGITTFIFASSCSVYGSQPDVLITEKSKMDPMDFYAKQKYLSERSIGYLKNSPTIFRFGTLFGLSPRMRFDLVINLFIAQAISSKKITVHGGSQYRPFLHVQDAANALIFALDKDLTGTFNAISKNYTILEAANKISDATGCEIETANEMEDPRNYNVSGKKMEMMGFTPQKRIEDAIEEIRDYILESKIDYKDKKYSNYELLFSSKEMQEKVFLLGI